VSQETCLRGTCMPRTCHQTRANSVRKSEKETRCANGSAIFRGSPRGKEPSNGVAVGSVGTSGTPPQGGVEKSSQARRRGAPRAAVKGAQFRKIEKLTSRPRGRKTRGVPVFFEAGVNSGCLGERRENVYLSGTCIRGNVCILGNVQQTSMLVNV
jgi:hypothetical protein